MERNLILQFPSMRVFKKKSRFDLEDNGAGFLIILHLREPSINVRGASLAIGDNHFMDLSVFASLSY